MIEGGGWVGVGDERTRVQAGEAVALAARRAPRGLDGRGAMRAIVVEFAGPMLALPGVIEGEALAIAPGEAHAPKGEGRLAPRRPAPAIDAEDGEGEPV